MQVPSPHHLGAPAPFRPDRAEAFALFLSRTARHRTGSRHTVKAYRTDLSQFGTFLGRHGCSVYDVTRGLATRWVAHLAGRDLEARTICRKVSTLRSFFRYLQQLELVDANPFAAVDTPSINQSSETHKVLSNDELEGILRVLRSDATAAVEAIRKRPGGRGPRRALFYAARRRAMIVLLATTGVRRSELVGLCLPDIERADVGFRLAVTGKGDKRRTLPLPKQTMPALFDWLNLRQRLPASTSHCFVSLDGRPATADTVRGAIRWLRKRVQTRYHLHPHMLRRSYATWHLAAHRDIRVVRDLLGHADIGTTQIYTAVEERQMRRAVAAAPIALSEQRFGPVIERLSDQPLSPVAYPAAG